MKRRLALTLATILLVIILCFVIAIVRPPRSGSGPAPMAPSPMTMIATFNPNRPPARPSGRSRDGCRPIPSYAGAAFDNKASLSTALVTPFGRPETGWEIYAPLIAQEIGAPCDPQSSGFAAAVGRWQSAHAQTPDGRIHPETLSAMTTLWLTRRPFVQAMRRGCPAAPDPSSLEAARGVEAFGGKVILARPAALRAYREMVAAAKRDLDVRPPLLTLASGFRGPEEETQRCADGGCGTASKARCSAHRTGLAFDVYLGAGPGFDAFSSADANRLFQTRTPIYRWLVGHADQFGFVPYPFEPWHWEWTGEPV